MKKHQFPRLKDKTTGLLNFLDYKKTSNKIGYAFIIIILAIFAFIAIVPLFWLLVTSFKTVNEINSNNYHFFPESFSIMKVVELWNKIKFGKYYLNTFIVVLGSMVTAVIFNGLLAYAIGILKPFGYKVINALVLLGYMIPSILSIFPLIMQIKNTGLMNTYWPLWLMFGANAYYYLLFKDYYEKLPSSLIEAARMDGCNHLSIFFRIVIPLSKPIIGVVAIFAMTASYSDFLLPYLVLQNQDYQTVMIAVYRLSGTTTLDTSEQLMLLVLSIIPELILFFIFQRQIMGTSLKAGMKE